MLRAANNTCERSLTGPKLDGDVRVVTFRRRRSSPTSTRSVRACDALILPDAPAKVPPSDSVLRV